MSAFEVQVAAGRPPVITVPSLDSVPAAAEWLSVHMIGVRAALADHGAVMIRGLPFRTPGEFGILRDRIIDVPTDYVERATPRSAFGNGVFTATDFPARRTIGLHNENSYAMTFPGVLVFGCLVAPVEGGGTTLGDMALMATRLPADLVSRFRIAGWMLSRTYWPHLGLRWQESFGTDDPADVERYARDHHLDVEWVDGRLRTRQTRGALLHHVASGQEVWFNHVAFWSEWTLDAEVREQLRNECGDDLPYRTYYGDGSPIAEDTIRTIHDVAAGFQIVEPWQPGDVLIVDNVRMAHGREAYRGDRTVLVAMGDPIRRGACGDHMTEGT